MGREDGDHDFGDAMGKLVGTLVVLAFMAAATAGYLLGDRYFSARAGLYGEAIAALAEGRLAHLTGDVAVPEGATDPLLGVSAAAVCIERDVRYYQWREERRHDSMGGEGSDRKYIHVKRWVREPVDSSRFRFRSRADALLNSVLASIPAQKIPAKQAMLGDYVLADAVKTNFPAASPLPIELTDEQLAAIQDRTMPGATRMGARLVRKIGENELYFGYDPASPNIGDVRVTLTAAWPGRASVVARAADGRLDAFTAANGERLALVRAGDVSAGRMLGGLSVANTLEAWGIRAGLVVAFWLLLRLLAVIHGGRSGGLFFAGLALAFLVMGVSCLMTRQGRLGGFLYLPVAAAAAGMWLAKRRGRG